jgi:hypothetical protein
MNDKEIIDRAAADEINRLHSEICDTVRTTVDKAIRIGELLTEQKASLQHGYWLPWLKAKIGFNARTAQRYMGVFENRAKLLKNDSVSYLTDAYQQLENERPKMSREEAERLSVEIGERFKKHMVEEVMPSLLNFGRFAADVLDRKLYNDWGANTFAEFWFTPPLGALPIDFIYIAIDFSEAFDTADLVQDHDAFWRAWDDHLYPRFLAALFAWKGKK